MFQIFLVIGWAAILVLLLYIWADVREIASVVKDSRRELMRSNFGGRTSGQQQTAWEQDNHEFQIQQEEASKEREQKTQVYSSSLKASEEQVLQEVLTEFLG